MSCFCYCCGEDLSSGEKKKRRRLLSSASMQGALTALSTIASEQQSDVDVSRLQDGYVCRNCSGLLERHASLHQLISSKIRAALPRLPSLAAADECSAPVIAPRSRIQHSGSAGAGPVAVTSDKSPVVVVSLVQIHNRSDA